MSEPHRWRDYSRSRAVLIGAWDYAHLPTVSPARNSLERMARLLTGPLCAWPEQRVRVLRDLPRRRDLPDQLMQLFDDVVDIALFYFVGHGQLHGDELCLALRESPSGGPRRLTIGLPFADVRAALRESDARTKIVILDCCFAGQAALPHHGLAASSTNVIDLTLGTGAFTMAASGAYRTAWYESGPDPADPQTYFTKYLIDVIEQGIPGQPDGLPLGVIFTHAADALARDHRPLPTRSIRHDADRFILARNTAGTAEPPPPAETIPSPIPPAGPMSRQSGLGALLHRALTRSDLTERNRDLPLGLPAVWVTLGELDRASALADSMSMWRTLALIRMVQAATPANDPRWYGELVAKTRAAVADESSPDYRAKLLGYLATALAAAGDGERAIKVAIAAEAAAVAFVTHAPARDAVLAELAEAVAKVGDHDRAARLARAIGITDNPDGRAAALTTVVAVVAAAGERDLALELARDARTAIEEDDPFGRPWDLSRLIEALAVLGEHDLYLDLITDAAEAAGTETDGQRRAEALAPVAVAAAVSGDHRRASELAATAENDAHAIIYDNIRADLFGTLMRAAAAIADGDWYEELAAEAETAARAVIDPMSRTSDLLALMEATEDRDRCRKLAMEAETTAHTIPEPMHRAGMLCELAERLVVTGDLDHAAALANATEATAHTTGTDLPQLALPEAVVATGMTGDHDRARRLAHGIGHPGDRARALAKVATVAAVAGHHDHAVELATAAEAIGRDLHYVWPLCEVVKAVTAIGDDAWSAALVTRAEAIAGAGADANQQAEALAMVAHAAAITGDHDRALDLAATAQAMTEDDGYFRGRALVSAVEAIAVTGDYDRAERLAGTITHFGLCAQALGAVVTALVADGHHERAGRIAQGIREPGACATALAAVAAAVAVTGSQGRALELAVAAETAARRNAHKENRDLTLGKVTAIISGPTHRSPSIDALTRRLVTEVLDTTVWYSVLPAVARISPEAMRALCDALLTRMTARE